MSEGVHQRFAAAGESTGLEAVVDHDGGAAATPRRHAGRTLAVLTASYPHPAFLFDAAGALQWTSQEGSVRLRLVTARVKLAGSGQGNEALRQLWDAACAACSDRCFDSEDQLRRRGLIGPGERVAGTRFRVAGHAMVLLVLKPSAAAAFPASLDAPRGGIPGLGAAESAVARLASEGFTVLNIAARLGIAETTVRTHLHRSYVKLKVHTRAQLAFHLFRGGR